MSNEVKKAKARLAKAKRNFEDTTMAHIAALRELQAAHQAVRDAKAGTKRRK